MANVVITMKKSFLGLLSRFGEVIHEPREAALAHVFYNSFRFTEGLDGYTFGLGGIAPRLSHDRRKWTTRLEDLFLFFFNLSKNGVDRHRFD